MKISLNWLKRYIELDKNPDELSEILTSIGLEVEGMEEVESIKGGLKGIIVAHVLECGKHPNADKLSLCKVDIGNDELLQVVCGAPNVEKGQKVMFATIGTTLYASNGEEWTIKKGKIRGEFSEGMICAEDELGIGTDHSGIIVLPEDTPIGMEASEYYNVSTDIVYEIGLTPNRSDATSHIGVAEDLAAYLKINEGHSGEIQYPDTHAFDTIEGDGGMSVEVLDVEGAPRYSGMLIEDLTIGESPDWLKANLKAIGINPKNNVVDITNFILHEYGQPLHAFDADKVNGKGIIVRTLPEGSTFVDLEEKERKLSDEDCMICDADSNGMCIGGVFGGINSGVSDNTTNIFLESAHFNSSRIRRTSTRHLLRTDAAVCFEKGSDPAVTVEALKRAALLMKEYANGRFASKVFDLYPNPIEKKKIEVSVQRINKLIGDSIEKEVIIDILESMNIVIEEDQGDLLVLRIPTNKADVTREADVIEEVLRIYGYNKVSVPGKISSTISNRPKPDKSALRNKVAGILTGFGFSEMMAISLQQSSVYSEDEKNQLVYINNTSNIHLNAMRKDLVYSALEAVAYNLNRQETALKLFEFGSSYWKDQDEICEKEQFSFFVTGSIHKTSWTGFHEIEEGGYYFIKSVVNEILESLGIERYQTSEPENPVFEFGLKYHRGTQIMFELGQVREDLCLKNGVKQKLYYAIANWEEILQAGRSHSIQVQEISKYPKLSRDLALILNKGVKYDEILKLARKVDKKILKEVSLFDIYEDESKIGKGKKSYAINFVFRDDTKTLKDKEVDKVMGKLIHSFEQNLSATIRK